MKIKKLFLVLGVILFSLVISGCTSVSYLKEGTYVSNNNIDNGDFKKAKYIISKIDKETFDSHNGVNVFIDAASSSNNPKYLLIELYLLSNATNKFELVTLSNIKHMGGTTNQYTMDAFLKLMIKNIMVRLLLIQDILKFLILQVHLFMKVIKLLKANMKQQKISLKPKFQNQNLL